MSSIDIDSGHCLGVQQKIYQITGILKKRMVT